MEDLIEDIRTQSGVSAPEIRKALGILMGFLLDTVKAPTAQKLETALPELAGLSTGHRATKGFFSSLVPPQVAMLALPGKLGKLGFDKSNAKKLLPTVGDWLKRHVDADLWDEVKEQLPGTKK